MTARPQSLNLVYILPGRSKIILGFAAVCAVAFLSRIPALRGDFHFDDFHHITANPAVKNPQGWIYLFTHPESFSALSKTTLYRPLTMAGFALNYQLAGLKPGPWLLVNLTLHALIAGLFFLLLLKWRGHFPSALLGGTLFAVMAVLSQPVSYLSNRATLLAVLFLLLGLLFDRPSEKDSEPRKFLRLLIALGFFGLALLSKETAAVFPALVVLQDLFLKSRKRDGFRILANAVYFAGLLFFLWLRWTMFDTIGSNFYPRTMLENFPVQARAVFHYLFFVFWPVHLSVVPEISTGPGLSSLPVLAALLALLGISAGVLVFWKRSGNPAFVWFWFLASFGPSILIPLNVLVSEERVYLSSLGLIFGLTLVFSRALEDRSRSRLVYALAALILLFQLALLEKRIPVWNTEKSLWRDGINKSPRLSATYTQYAQALMDADQQAKAFGFFQKALTIEPTNATAYGGLCRYYLVKKEYEVLAGCAQEFFNLADHPAQKSQALAYLANAQFEAGDLEEARQTLNQALSLSPGRPEALYLQAVISSSLGGSEDAQAYLRQALEANPDVAEYHGLLGVILAQEGKAEQAIGHLRIYTEGVPEDPSGWFNLGMALAAVGDVSQARVNFEKAVALEPGYALAHYGLAMTRFQLGDREGALFEANKALGIDSSLAQARILRAAVFIDQLNKGIFTTAPAKQAILSKVQSEIKWLKKNNIDTRPLEKALAEIPQ